MRNLQAIITNLPVDGPEISKGDKNSIIHDPTSTKPTGHGSLTNRHDWTQWGVFFQTTTKPENHPNMNRNILYQCSVCWVPSLGFRRHESIILIAIAGWCFEPIYHQCTFYPCTSGSFFFWHTTFIDSFKIEHPLRSRVISICLNHFEEFE